jgi:hypothetical protein
MGSGVGMGLKVIQQEQPIWGVVVAVDINTQAALA